MKRWVIIGAGPTGLGAAHRLKELGEAFTVLEAGPEPGGLCRSFVDSHGFTWDLGGHVLFSHFPYFDDLMAKALGEDGWYRHQREAWARLLGAWVPYPVQNNLRHLPKEALARCLAGLVKLYQRGPADAPPANFGEWIDATFGAGLAGTFMRPYNFKVWAYPAEELAWSWIGERVAVTDLERVLNNVILERDDVSWGPNNTFGFPKRGGTGAIWKALADRIGQDGFSYGTTVRSVDPDRKVVRTHAGVEVPYDVLISTMPVDQLAGLVTGLEPEAVAAARALSHSSTNVVGLGLAGATPEVLRTKCWIYFSEPNVPFYRATVFSNYSPSHVPDPSRFWSLLTETSESPRKPVDGARLVAETIDGAIAAGLIEHRSQVVSVWRHRVEYGYPTPTVNRDESLSRVLPALERRSIFSRGRFGAWRYEIANMDHSLMQGVELVDRLTYGTSETVFQ